MKNLVLCSFLLLGYCSISGQQKVDSSYAFQTNAAKKYSIYVPSSYTDSIPNKMMLGLHPFNTLRWDAEAWRDTLTSFAETNGLLLICPDGGVNGRIDDAIDVAFTTDLIDSVKSWYNVDTANIYAMGFSVGGKATYTYGLNNDSIFGGFIPIGAAISGTQEVNVSLQRKSKDKPFYIIHGSFDSPFTRFFPVRDSLIAKGAIVKTNYMVGVGHTIDFPNRNSILTSGFNWIDSVNNAFIVSLSELKSSSEKFLLFPNPIYREQSIKFDLEYEMQDQYAEIRVYDIGGKEMLNSIQQISKGTNTLNSNLSSLSKGTYFLTISLKRAKKRFIQEFILQ